MSQTQEPVAPTSNEAESHGRRNFLTKSAVLLTALGVSAGAAGGAAAAVAPAWGGASTTPAANTSEGQALNEVLTEGARTGDIRSALQAHGQALNPQAQAVLSKLTASDLREIASLQTKLAGLRGNIAADNNGTIGM